MNIADGADDPRNFWIEGDTTSADAKVTVLK